MQIEEHSLKDFISKMWGEDQENIKFVASTENIISIMFRMTDSGDLLTEIECTAIAVECNGKSQIIKTRGVFPVATLQAIDHLNEISKRKKNVE